MLITFFEAVLWMIPIVILENVTNYFLIVRTNLPKDGLCGMCILSSFLQAYLIAGFFEESAKYLAVRRIIYKSYVVDPRALVVYSCCAGSAFGTVEDLMYNLSYGLGTAIVRAFTSVPLHCATGLIIGTSLAERKFFQQDTERWYKTLILPVLIHGACTCAGRWRSLNASRSLTSGFFPCSQELTTLRRSSLRRAILVRARESMLWD